MYSAHHLESMPVTGKPLRLLSYNVQMGISSSSHRHYLTNLWKHVLPAPCRFRNLNRIADLLAGYDLVALQELDAGSHRTGYVDLTAYLAQRAGFSFWHHQLNRDLGHLAQHGNALLSRNQPTEIREHRLPGKLPGRGALEVRYGQGADSLMIVMLHLALGQRTRQLQLDFVCELLAGQQHAVLMGDLNCSAESPEMERLFHCTRLIRPDLHQPTFPSWRPRRCLDHILVTPGLRVSHNEVINHACSDHLPVAMELSLPDTIRLSA